MKKIFHFFFLTNTNCKGDALLRRFKQIYKWFYSRKDNRYLIIDEPFAQRSSSEPGGPRVSSPRRKDAGKKGASVRRTRRQRARRGGGGGRRIASLAPLESVDRYADARGRMHLLILIGASRRGRDSARGCR